MDFDAAIAAHQRWKVKLRMAIDSNAGDLLDADGVSRDDHCELGHWLRGEGRLALGDRPSFGELVEIHKKFHQVAGEILVKARAGDKAGATASLYNGFFRASTGVIQALLKIKAEGA